jgi:murein DD-endopeptidase / murein LD-carboxypeptidase
MRIQIRLLKPSWILLIVLLFCGHNVFSQQELMTNSSLQPAFMHGIFMGIHHKELLATLLLDIPGSLAKARPDSGIPLILIRNVDMTDVVVGEDIQKNVSNENVVVIKDVPVVVANDRVKSRGKKQEEPKEIDYANDESTFALLEEDVDTLVSRYAEMIAVDPQDINNYSLYRFIDHWYGAPYRWGGNEPSGIDCSGFSQKLYGKVYGMDILRTARQQRSSCERIKDFEDASEGDLVFFRMHRLRVSHVGVYLANGYFVHASRSRGVMISSLNDRYWHRRYAGCGRIDRENKTSAESDFLQ